MKLATIYCKILQILNMAIFLGELMSFVIIYIEKTLNCSLFTEGSEVGEQRASAYSRDDRQGVADAPSTYYCQTTQRTNPSELSIRTDQNLIPKVEIKCVFDDNLKVPGLHKIAKRRHYYGSRFRRMRIPGYPAFHSDNSRPPKVAGLSGHLWWAAVRPEYLFISFGCFRHLF